MKKALTLIEIMISVVIIFIIMGVMLETTSNTKHLFLINKDYNGFVYKSSVAIFGNGKNTYEKLKDFNIRNDQIIHTLKHDKINIKKELDYSMNENINNQNINISINKIRVYNKYHQTVYYSVDIK